MVDEEERSGRVLRELAALGLIALALYALLSLVSHDAGRHPNLGGPLGAGLAGFLEYSFGAQAYVLAVLVGWLAQRIWAGICWRTLTREMGGGAVLVVALSVAAAFCNIAGVAAGGLTGTTIAVSLGAYLNFAGGYLIVILAIVGGLALIAGRAPTELAASVAGAARRSHRSPAADSGQSDRSSLESGSFDNGVSSFVAAGRESLGEGNGEIRLVRRPEPSKITPERAGAHPQPPRVRGGYKLPPLDLLDVPPLEHAQVDKAALEKSARVLEQKLSDFGVDGQVVEVQPGPVVTMYKLEPGSGIKVSQIVNLADDLSMALRAATVRILAPVPGEAVVGIEVPNRKREKIYLREILEAEQFSASRSQLTIALGKDISGRPAAADLATMPHLLIAGATGTGKSVSIHTMISSILFNATADDVRFILIDPKMLELSVYEGIPHLLVPVVVDPEKAAAALLWATREMETRYRMMRDLGVRNIDGYNNTIGEGAELVELRRGTTAENAGESGDWVDTPVKHHRLPKIVIVIDELADLLLSEGK
ncbi:MAG TPA: DNA translocase FtsK 4TM domain-containing protein, partial [Candidatus Binataceae bacterium]|nr:DNA translocase FtsK 4TM domain-containing protein [Candidatus Binataceae bacterium]